MNKLITLILFVVSLAVAQNTYAVAPTIKVLASDVTVNVDQTYTFSVTADNFNHISIQFTLLFNSNLLEFVSYSEVNPALDDYQLNYVPPGSGSPEGLTSVWVSPTLNPVSLPNGTVLYKVTLKGKAPGVTQVNIPCGGDYVCEAIDGNGNIFTSFPSTPSNVTITGTQTFDKFTVGITDEVGLPGSEVCVKFIAYKDFTNISLMQMSFVYDTTKLMAPITISNCNSQFQFDCSNPGANFNVTNGKGFVTWNYNASQPNGVTLPDGTVMFEVCFTVKANVPLGTKIPIIFQDEQFFKNEFYQHVGNDDVLLTDVTLINGSITTGAGGGKKITITGSNESGIQGTEVCMDITAANFTKLTSLEFGLMWDPGVITFSKVQACHPSLGINNCGAAPVFTKTGNNKLCFNWTEPNPGTGVTLPTNAKLFEVCYNVIGFPGEVADITIGSNANCPASAVDTDGDSFQMVFNNGSISIPTTAPVVIKVTDKDVCPGQMVCFPITTDNFTNLSSAEFAIHWDQTKLELKGIQNCYPPLNVDCDTISTNFNHYLENLIFSWLHTGSGCGLTIPNGTTLFEICFNVIGANGTSSPLEIVPNPTNNALELTDCQGNPVNVDTVNQNIKITSLACCNLSIGKDVTNPACKGGSDGSIFLTVTGGSGSYTYKWSPNVPSIGNPATNLAAGFYDVTVTDNNNPGCTATALQIELKDGEDFQVSATSTPSDCAGNAVGSITLAFTGGVPLLIAWTSTSTTVPPPGANPASNLSPGFYTASVTSNKNCTKTITVEITKPLADITISAEPFNPKCFNSCDGSIFPLVTPIGPNYTYQWSTTPVQTTKDLTNLCAGAYTVTVTEPNGCTKSETYILINPTDISISVSSTKASTETSADGTATVTASGGTPPYSYKWSTIPVQTTPTATGLLTGTYNVTVTDANGCTKTSSVFVDFIFIPPPTKELTIVNSLIIEHKGYGVSCFGECDGSLTAVLPNTAVPPFIYKWTGNVPNGQSGKTVIALCTGSYNVTVVDAIGDSYTAKQAFTITSPPQLTVNLLTDTDPTPTVEVIASGGVAPYQYKVNGGQYSILNKFDIDGFSPITVIVLDANGCTVTQTIPGPLNRSCNDGRLVITPNGDDLNEYFVLGCATTYPCNKLTIFDRYGRTVYSKSGYINDWNGTDESGNPLPEGGYFWAFEFFNAYPCPSLETAVPIVAKGSITITR